jgi:hypothetical protein
MEETIGCQPNLKPQRYIEQVRHTTQPGWYAPQRVEMARGRRFERRLEVPKTPVLPLDDPRTVYKVRVELLLWSFYCTHISMHYKRKFCGRPSPFSQLCSGLEKKRRRNSSSLGERSNLLDAFSIMSKIGPQSSGSYCFLSEIHLIAFLTSSLSGTTLMVPPPWPMISGARCQVSGKRNKKT